MDNLEAGNSDCCQRHPTAGGRNIMSSLVLPLPALRLSLACREFSTWAADRDLWRRIQNFRLLSCLIFSGKVQILFMLSTGDVITQLFLSEQKCWCQLIQFSWSLAALKGALVTIRRPLWAGLRISFQLEGNPDQRDWRLLQREQKHLSLGP